MMRKFVAAGIFSVALTLSPAAAQTSQAPQRFADLGDFKLVRGQTIHACKMEYRTLGPLNAAKVERDSQADPLTLRDVQAIRPAVINRKTSGGNRTLAGASAQAVLISILRTCKQRSLDALSVFTQILRSPSPLAY